VLGGLIMLIGTARCGGSAPGRSTSATTLRVGVGGLSQSAPQAGLQQVVTSLSLEALVLPSDDGRLRPWLAESWTTAPDGLSVTVHLRRQAKFHDGTPVTAPLVVQALQKSLPGVMGPAFDDVDQIVAVDAGQVRVDLRQPSRFLIEALEIPIQKSGKDGVGTGPYIASGAATPAELHANADYYLGPPAIDRITITPYPSVRTAWAELLRGNLDMLHEVNIDALDSLQASSNVSVFSYARHYQYAIVFGSHAAQLKPATIRRELNAAIDRAAIIREAFNGHGIPSTGPVPPQHWALGNQAPKLAFDRTLAASLPHRHLTFTCLVPADSVYERIALLVKRQLAAASVDMRLEEATQDQVVQAARSNDFEAILADLVSGPTMFRSYRHLYSKVPFQLKPVGSPLVDAALDRMRHASSDDDYRQAVAEFQRTIVDDPPELFLAWGERARAVSRRFDVPVPEDGRDVLATLRLWRPVVDQRATNRN
jgi:peptide/nickel transport system substrate-binding protein